MQNVKAIAGVTLVATICITLLIIQRLQTAPQMETITLVDTYCSADLTADACWQNASHETAYEMRTPADHYREYQAGAVQFLLDQNTWLTADGERYRFDTGRVVVNGQATLTVRDVAVQTDGLVTLVHYSWLNKLDVKVIQGSADIRQGDYTSTVSEGNAVGIDTLPPYDAIAPTKINTEAVPFYDWALN